MRKLDLPPRTCACGAIMFRWRYSNGRLEPPKRFAKRRFCSNACKRIGYLKPTWGKARACLQCSARLVRKQFRGGRWEERKTFAKRRFCSNACKAAYLDDPITRTVYGRYWAERLAAARARNPSPSPRVCGPRKALVDRRGDRSRCEFCVRGRAAKGDIVCARCQKTPLFTLDLPFDSDITKFFNYEPQPEYLPSGGTDSNWR